NSKPFVNFWSLKRSDYWRTIMGDEMIYSNGIDAQTGNYLLPPMSTEEFVKLAKGARPEGWIAKWFSSIRAVLSRPFLGLPYDVDPKEIAQAGWAIVFPQNSHLDLRNALEPPIAHRRRRVPPDRLKILEDRRNETVLDWLKRHRAAPGNVDPKKVPYYVLLIGVPTEIPFDFQYLLDVEYAVGRLGFDHIHQYQKYVESIVNYETTAKVANSRET